MKSVAAASSSHRYGSIIELWKVTLWSLVQLPVQAQVRSPPSVNVLSGMFNSRSRGKGPTSGKSV